MEKTRRLSSWEITGLVTSFGIALVAVGSFVLIQAGIASNESFKSLLLVLHPISGLILLVQMIHQLKQPDWNKFLIGGWLASGLVVLVSGTAWIQLILSPSHLN